MSDPDPPTVYVVRNEPDPDSQYHCDALASWFPAATEVDFVAGDEVLLDGPDGADGVVLSGSTAGVYEADSRPWIDDQMALVRALVDREVPTLGVCFGHQVVNAALGGTVEVNRRTGGLTYDLRIDGAPINLTVYKTQTGGRRQTVVDAPGAAPVTGLQGRYRPERKPEFPNWALRAPFVAYRPSVGQPGFAKSAFALGVTLTRRAQIPLGAVAFMEVGMAATPPITNPQARPVFRGGIEWTF